MMKDREPNRPNWLIFVDKAPDDGPWLRMMVLNPLNGAMSTMINTPIDADPRISMSESAPMTVARD
jgi:hypothetical protein